MADSLASLDHPRLLPADWSAAPLRYWREDRYGAFTFIWANLILGTLGLWAPFVGALLTGHPIPQLARGMLASGSVYLFVIPFVASIAYSVFTAAHILQTKSRPWRLEVLKGALFLALLICVFLMPFQVFAQESMMTLNACVQIGVSVLSVVVGLYVFCLLKLDVEIPFTEEMSRMADKLKAEANKANSNPSDFDS